jgi:broad specificity phosphatase PhoE
LHLVRHGRAAAGWDTDPDPGLDDIGRRQAVEAATTLAALVPCALVSSPLRRCHDERTGSSELVIG